MIITTRALAARIRRNGKQNYRYIGRCTDSRYPDGSGYTLAVINDCHNQETIHVDADDAAIEKLCGPCENA